MTLRLNILGISAQKSKNPHNPRQRIHPITNNYTPAQLNLRAGRLIRAAGRGDTTAVGGLFDLLAPGMLGALTSSSHSHTANEVLEDVFLAIWERAPRAHTARISPLEWIGAIVRERMIARVDMAASALALNSPTPLSA